jgi:hypothetical protein
MLEFDPEIEKMILYGIEYTNFYESRIRDSKIKYRAISDLEERFAFKDLLEEIPLESEEDKLKLFEKSEVDEFGKETETFKQKLDRLGVSPMDMEIANYQHRISIVYHGIKDFYFKNISYDKGLELVSRFPEEDINALSDLILEISSKTFDKNEKRVARFRA